MQETSQNIKNDVGTRRITFIRCIQHVAQYICFEHCEGKINNPNERIRPWDYIPEKSEEEKQVSVKLWETMK